MWTAPPAYCGNTALQKGNTDAPLLGNGDIGVVLCGSLAEASGLTWYIGKNDFWSTNNQDVTHNMYQSVASVARVTMVPPQIIHVRNRSASSPYSIQQHLLNASVTSRMGYTTTVGGAATLATASIVAANDNVLIVRVTSTVDSAWSMYVYWYGALSPDAGCMHCVSGLMLTCAVSDDTVHSRQLSAGSAEGAKRGLPVSAGTVKSSRGNIIHHIARNSSSLDNQYPTALARDCRDRMLDAFGQQSFVIDPDTRLVTVAAPPKESGVGAPADGEARCLLVKPTLSPAARAAPPALQREPAITEPALQTTVGWRVFDNVNALYYPTKAANIHTISNNVRNTLILGLYVSVEIIVSIITWMLAHLAVLYKC